MAWIEKPDYEVILSEGSLELRKYKAMIVAEVVRPRGSDLNMGFQDIFNYISGQNQGEQKISMTAPVINRQGEDYFATAFVMPSQYTLETLPVPKDPNVSIKERVGGTFAVIRFSGSWSEARFRERQKQLEDWIRLHGWQITSELTIARYNPPFTPAVLRRNELMYQIKME
ncbi:SOUL family heme-binding protein [Acidaminobacter hydrogenoformans]|uniref:SOUL heme-binding protein n=1 Tax=Acidaminobacter hydrogenoformans DSM 2784 TaxID=1120920 RepID=A0A1G5RUS6_9FIRM|nr:heme-binding protein [Acidaminobacter hydrogenoformans]SCZ77657.1 SOUL heme-binding protein [Acidaminobacter hydrogenoformans DSM 2784]